VGRTRILEGQPRHPIWNESFSIYCAHTVSQIKVSTKDAAIVGTTVVGRAHIPAIDLLSGVTELLFILEHNKSSIPRFQCAVHLCISISQIRLFHLFAIIILIFSRLILCTYDLASFSWQGRQLMIGILFTMIMKGSSRMPKYVSNCSFWRPLVTLIGVWEFETQSTKVFLTATSPKEKGVVSPCTRIHIWLTTSCLPYTLPMMRSINPPIVGRISSKPSPMQSILFTSQAGPSTQKSLCVEIHKGK
jgi:hypothetical protein